VETAFLYGTLDEKIYMRVPKGMTESGFDVDQQKEALHIKRSIYGLVQAARQWWKRLVTFMTNDENGFVRSHIDACLLYRNDEDGEVVFGIYINDMICTGNRKAIDKTIGQLKSEFSIKTSGCLQEYVGCKVKRDKVENKIYLQQPYLIGRIEKQFGEAFKGMPV
jgi:hypothetical protein